MRWFVALAVSILFLLPVADALSVATRTAKVRPSAEYSPETAWEAGFYGCNVTVAIFDEGVDDEHPWLAGKVAAGVDVTATGVVWDEANEGNPQPLQGSHGTPVAGIVMGHAGLPMFSKEQVPAWEDDDHVGVAPCAWIVDVQFNDVVGAGSAADGEMVAAFEWAIANVANDWGDSDPSNDGIDIITMSWSPDDETDGTAPVCMAAERAIDAGIVVLGSAGNSGKLDGEDDKPELGCPTGSDRSLSIANICDGGPQNPTARTVDRYDDRVCSHSTWGPRTDDGDDNLHEELQPDIAAPGQGIMSTSAATLTGREYTLAGCGDDSMVPDETLWSCDTSFGGTSAATPFMAGVVALMLDANPGLSPEDVKEILHQTAEPLPDHNATEPELNAKWNYRRGYGMVDAYAAVMMAVSWPGLALGADTDSDGVRDYLDHDPYNALVAVRKAVKDLGVLPAGGELDSDGDGVVDALDGAPLDPARTDASDARAEDAATPVGWLAAVAVVIALLVRRR